MIYQIDNYLCRYNDILQKEYDNIPYAEHYEKHDDPKINKLHKDIIKQTGIKLTTIFKKYNNHEYFISRPIKGITADKLVKMNKVIKKIHDKFNDSKIFYAVDKDQDKNQDFGTQITSYRIEIIKQSAHFILIYPKVGDCNLPPSSCLIELGVALAYNKPVILLSPFYR